MCHSCNVAVFLECLCLTRGAHYVAHELGTPDDHRHHDLCAEPYAGTNVFTDPGNTRTLCNKHAQ